MPGKGNNNNKKTYYHKFTWIYQNSFKREKGKLKEFRVEKSTIIAKNFSTSFSQTNRSSEQKVSRDNKI